MSKHTNETSAAVGIVVSIPTLKDLIEQITNEHQERASAILGETGNADTVNAFLLSKGYSRIASDAFLGQYFLKTSDKLEAPKAADKPNLNEGVAAAAQAEGGADNGDMAEILGVSSETST